MFFKKFNHFIYLILNVNYIQGVSGGIVNILGGGSIDELQNKIPYNTCPIFIEYRDRAEFNAFWFRVLVWVNLSNVSSRVLMFKL